MDIHFSTAALYGWLILQILNLVILGVVAYIFSIAWKGRRQIMQGIKENFPDMKQSIIDALEEDLVGDLLEVNQFIEENLQTGIRRSFLGTAVVNQVNEKVDLLNRKYSFLGRFRFIWATDPKKPLGLDDTNSLVTFTRHEKK